MIDFLKRWYREFKNEQAIKNPLQSTMMTKEEVGKALNEKQERDIILKYISTIAEGYDNAIVERLNRHKFGRFD
ncbi:hypothetical protein [Photobacterium leiognathi]|uniref:hypothetical protein n=1 Tax=Photobacterium leiognathi TaxID=553611 RepID=UPI002738D4F2|nr:hypothetical protein [Photobacterium leiognathi]